MPVSAATTRGAEKLTAVMENRLARIRFPISVSLSGDSNARSSRSIRISPSMLSASCTLTPVEMAIARHAANKASMAT